MAGQHAYNDIEASLSAIVEPGSVFEIRCLGGAGRRKRIDAGYFDSPANAAVAIANMENNYAGIYLTVNPVVPDLICRSANRIQPFAEFTTMDGDVLRRRWLLIDIDPIRPAGISSTDAEHDAAANKAEAVATLLRFQYGWPYPMINDSGNGAHLMYPFDGENDVHTRDTVAQLLKCLAARFNDNAVQIDTTVFNAARIWRLPGTWARKGDNHSTRPHRQARIRYSCGRDEPVRVSDVQHVINDTPKVAPEANGRLVSGVLGLPADENKYKHLNNTAMSRLADWVPFFFPDAREYKAGYRITSADLGRDNEEDLTIHPWPLGIKDFGVADQGDGTEGRRTPVGLVAQWWCEGDKDLAARRLADRLQAPLSEFPPLPPPIAAAQLPGIETPRIRFDFSNIGTVEDLRRREFTETKYIIDKVLPVGNIMLAARPKMRKTWLALQLGIAVATGGKFLEWTCNKGDVLFLGLEDNDKRIRYRIRTLQTFDINPLPLHNFRYWTGGVSQDAQGREYVSDPEQHARTYASFPRGEAGVDALDQYLDKFPKTSLIVIDTLQHFKESSTNRDIYARDYDAQMPITKLAHRRGVLILPVTHEKKGLAGNDSADFLEDVTGSAGMTGGSDGVMSIKGRRGVQEENESRKLYITGRDVPNDYEVDMSFDAERGGWLPAARTDVKVALRTLLSRHPFINQQEMTSLLPNVPKGRLVKCLMEMKFEGEIQQSKFGYSMARGI